MTTLIIQKDDNSYGEITNLTDPILDSRSFWAPTKSQKDMYLEGPLVIL